MPPVSWRRILGGAALIAAGLGLLYLLRGTWPPFVLALVLTYLLAPAVDFLEAQGLRRATAILLLYLLITLAAAVALVYLLPGFLDELNRLGTQLPGYARRLRLLVEGVRQDAARATLPATVRQAVLQQIDRTEGWVTARLADLTGGLVEGLLGAAPLLLAPVLAFYLLDDLPRLRRWAQDRLGRGHRRRWLDLVRAVDQVVGGFIRGQLLVAGFVGLMVTAVATFFGLRFAVLLGALAALADLIPYFGPIIGAVPVLAMAALQSPATALKVAVALLLVQWVENSVLSPRILGQRVGVHPLVVISALLVGGHHFGLAGLLFAVPVAGLAHVLLAFAWPDWVGGLDRLIRRNPEPGPLPAGHGECPPTAPAPSQDRGPERPGAPATGAGQVAGPPPAAGPMAPDAAGSRRLPGRRRRQRAPAPK
ncbi:AI-2E family transporter [Thermaerobacter sp. PB12/4term]|uniref:AI-2E family transporter n=1 Tax=Thermaerobacter sp. PB12/4term TaxID=2293838 RepID=UPI000E3295A3|nr:AI-2E family transporter [Thermaerobacter sp. PB12/4term]QIA27148.1 AI-2E family transporter [Thermaerobacter sp. PB12/4term]